MKKFSSRLLIVTSCITAPVHAVEFWHSSTVWAGQGQCSAMFTFDSGMEEVRNLHVSVTVANKIGKKVSTGVLEIPQFGQSSANRYADAFLEGEEICADDLTNVVTEATAIVRGKRTDLLKSKALSARDFRPFKVRVGNKTMAR